MTRLNVAVLMLVASAFSMGCEGSYTGPPGVIVKGKILRDGQPLVVSAENREVAAVDLVGPGLAEASGILEPDGSFTIDYAGEGIPPGKYRLAVAIRQGGAPGTDSLGGKLSPDTTPIEIDVPQDKVGKEHDLGVIDIGQHLK